MNLEEKETIQSITVLLPMRLAFLKPVLGDKMAKNLAARDCFRFKYQYLHLLVFNPPLWSTFLNFPDLILLICEVRSVCYYTIKWSILNKVHKVHILQQSFITSELLLFGPEHSLLWGQNCLPPSTENHCQLRGTRVLNKRQL